MGNTQDKENRVPCSFCGKTDPPHNDQLKEAGTNVGNSQSLARILMVSYGGVPAREHPLSRPKGEGSCVQAHHLICSESMDDDDWGEICANFGYNINCKENGVFLPADMKVACQFRIPLHRGNHSATETTENMNYVGAVLKKIRSIKADALSEEKEFCKTKRDIIAELNQKSNEIWSSVKSFSWTLSYDGKDYLGGLKGCLGATSLRRKREIDATITGCPEARNHNLILKGAYYLER